MMKRVMVPVIVSVTMAVSSLTAAQLVYNGKVVSVDSCQQIGNIACGISGDDQYCYSGGECVPIQGSHSGSAVSKKAVKIRSKK